ncbi:MAG TPA: serine hydrolase [Capsulimonadaceae bacterium]|nr:serine hydrolase [Capsulimonadaceae bacterium]
MPSISPARTLLILIAACIFVLAAPRVAYADKIDDYVQRQMQAQHIPGLSLAIVKNGKIAKARGYGLADLEQKTPATPQTLYELASVTKQLTATAVMLLVQDGKIGLDDKISQYVKGTPNTWRDITLRELLNQTSGIKDILNELRGTSQNDATPQEIVDDVALYPLDFAPGTDWSYSNTNYLLLGMVIGEVTGMDFSAFLTERVFRPLGMTSTRLDSDADIIPKRAGRYSWDGSRLTNSALFNGSLWRSGEAGLMSNVLDMARWDGALLGGKILSTASEEETWSPGKLSDGALYPYGFGWFLWDFNGRKVISHEGSAPGVSTGIAHYLNDKLAVVVFMNRDGVNALALAGEVANLYDPAVAARAAPDQQGPDPRATALMRSVLMQLQQGTPDHSLFTQKMQFGTTPDFLRYAKQFLAPLGELRTLIFISRSDRANGQIYRYEAIFENGGLDVNFTLTKDGKIDDAGWVN